MVSNAPAYRSGDHFMLCAICGFRFFRSELRKNYRGFFVCDRDFELRHEQETIRVPVDKISVPDVLHETDTNWIDPTINPVMPDDL